MEATAAAKPRDLQLISDNLSIDPTADESFSMDSLRLTCILSCFINSWDSVSAIEENMPSWKKSIVIRPKNMEKTQIFMVKRIDDEESTELCLEMMK